MSSGFAAGLAGAGLLFAAALVSVDVSAAARSAAPASGCGHASTTGSGTLSATVRGKARTAIVHVPRGYTGSKRLALVLNMHGSGATAVEQEELSGMDATSDQKGFVVAYPQGLIPDGTGYDWNVPGVPLFGGKPVPAGAADDIAFLTALVGTLEQRYCIDTARVYATGFSGGARIASQLACDESTVFAAAAPVSGLRHPNPCLARAVPELSFHGTSDPVDPYNGHGQPYWTSSVPQAASAWAVQDGCTAKPVTTQPVKGKLALTTYGSCKQGATVELYSLNGEGHEWPGGPQVPRLLERVFGPQSTAIDADAEMWAFFSAHPL